ARQPLADAEYLVQLVVEPGAGGRAAEQVVVIGEALPHLARIGLDGRSVPARNAEGLERDAMSVQQAQDVVVGLHHQRGGLREGLVPGQDPRLFVAGGREARWTGRAS